MRHARGRSGSDIAQLGVVGGSDKGEWHGVLRTKAGHAVEPGCDMGLAYLQCSNRRIRPCSLQRLRVTSVTNGFRGEKTFQEVLGKLGAESDNKRHATKADN
ncbi:hypothetical protein HPP92_029123 [Vanilla planifolia]|uniref:Uncharacterized protein n=1 Tax=Vanilla planifolia TaxID=51239 RepID=A0A835P3K2_VANPL|nr:hypothetical protein HPP92_029123 [Vanilla planifolia]KAG0445879.1 hypothetical protein HPP92_029111 [Vanilla planifolia]